MKALKFTLLTFATLAPALSRAGSICMAKSDKDQIVTVNVSSTGTMAYARDAAVEIRNSEGDLELKYLLDKSEIAQYFDGCRDSDCETAIVGLSAYRESNFPVAISFIGKDFFMASENDPIRTLKDYLLDPNRSTNDNNTMRVWNGISDTSDFEKTYINLKDVVCELDHDV